MIPRAAKIWLFFFWLGLSSTAIAQLKWDSTEQEFDPDYAASEVTATYHFTNIGNTTITIQNVKSSCGCTTATLEKNTYAPGEEGDVNATFTFGERYGPQTKTIVVKSDDPENPKTTLVLSVYIPQLLNIDPFLLTWERNSDPTAQIINIEVQTDFLLHITELTASDPGFNTELKEIDPGKIYQIAITPLSTEKLAKAYIAIKTDYPKENPREFRAFCLVK